MRVERNGPVTTVILDRPEVRNAVDRPTADALASAFLAFEHDEQCAGGRALWGAGGTFCAGADLKGVADGRGNRLQAPRPDFDPLDGATRRWGRRGMRLSKPVIAAVVRLCGGGRA